MSDLYYLLTGKLGGAREDRGLVLDDLAAALPAIFREASNSDIRLQIDTSRSDSVQALSSTPAHSLDLHLALAALTQNPLGLPRILRVGLLFASDYAFGSDVLGAMFDRGFATSDDPYGADGQFTRPREGCAVFLGAISRLRTQVDEDYRRQVQFTAVHELGHLFNLGHSDGANYMRKTDPETLGHASFSAGQRSWLSHCSSSPEVWPGGERYSGGDGGWDRTGRSGGRGIEGLELSIELSRDHAFPWEPVELEVRLRLARNARGNIRLPNELDPGYGDFRIWIEEPNGERRTYRSPQTYCALPSVLTLLPGQSFTRDIALFGEAGGYTFRRSGHHRVWLEWQPRRSTRLVSQKRTIDVLGPGSRRPGSSVLLRKRSIARILFHRRAHPGSPAFRVLQSFVHDRPRDPNAVQLAYCVGRALADASKRVRRATDRRSLSRQAREWLARASDHKRLGEHARRKALRLADELGAR